MSISAKVGSFNVGTAAAASTVVVSSLGFQPKWILFWWSGLAAASNGVRQTSYRGMGWACSASDFKVVATRDLDGAGTAVTANGARADACIGQISDLGDWTGGTVIGAGWADLQSFDADGFTLEIIDQFGVDLYVSYLALGGTVITNVESGVFTAVGTAPVNQVVSNVGNFQPKVTFFLSAELVADAPTSAGDSILMFGAASSSTAESVWHGGADNGATSGAAGSYCRSGESIGMRPSSPQVAPTQRAEFISHNASPGGFTVNWLERSASVRAFWCSIAGGDWLVGDFLTQTDIVTSITETGFASQPAAVLVVSAGKAETVQDATPDTHDTWSVGAATSASERAVQYVDSRSGNTAMFVHLAARSDAIYENTDPAQTAYTEVGRGDIVSMDATGFTAIMDDADPVQAFAWYVAVGESAASGLSIPVVLNQYRQRSA